MKPHLLVAILAVSGCTTTPDIQTLSKRHHGVAPAPGETSIAEIGNPLHTEFDYTATPSRIIEQPVKKRQRKIPAGTSFDGLRINGQRAYCNSKHAYSELYLCLYDTDDNGNFDHYIDIAAGQNWPRELPKAVPYKEAITYANARGYRYELLYHGRTGNTISIGYREYYNDMMRPNHTQIVTYDLAHSDEIGFKGARLKIINADNTAIKYRIIKGFSSPK